MRKFLRQNIKIVSRTWVEMSVPEHADPTLSD